MKLELMGLKISTEPKAEILKELDQRLKSGKKSFITTPYSEFFYYAYLNFDFKQAINHSDFAIPDGISVLWLAHYLSIPLTSRGYYARISEAFWQLIYSNFQIIFAPSKIHRIIKEKITGSNFFWDLVDLANKENLGIYLLGGFSDTPELVAKKIQQKYPNIKIAGYSNLNPGEISIKDINAEQPDLLMVAYGPIRQEQWIAQNLEHLNCKIVMGVGGTFDYIAGKKSAPPKFLREAGLEWLYRLITQPNRFKRIWIATFVFLKGALRHKVFATLPFRENVAGVIMNPENKMFIGQRARQDRSTDKKKYWQLPQGGVDPGETPEQAILREMAEETGMKNLKILGQSSQKFTFDFPHMLYKLFGSSRRFRGQTQTIFYLKYDGGNTDIKLEQDELNDYKWVEPAQSFEYIHPIRHEMLRIALKELPKFI